jgi:hypothetical protein
MEERMLKWFEYEHLPEHLQTVSKVFFESIVGKFRVASTVPKRRTKAYSFAFRDGGKLAFNDMSDDNVHQMTMD